MTSHRIIVSSSCRPISARGSLSKPRCRGWHRYVGDGGDVLAIERFGASAPGNIVMEKFGFTVDHVVERARALIGK